MMIDMNKIWKDLVRLESKSKIRVENYGGYLNFVNLKNGNSIQFNDVAIHRFMNQNNNHNHKKGISRILNEARRATK